ncbi:GntR family transcriptional regulator [Nocardia puris]|uniref:DNA-binding GntR family transcriptional regulator n=1 Tax=Nocardia puris TaxID=208602 RepID=A0A366DN03_9NOCA|nr:GntR family transcriptional regulator [Nocardia puris]MBF6211256.1 GntR family transcriptional regulator [Nocardia puris]MBF6364975.1 GntR family transcriptional regulator [Nocardia puris]MBF6458761.1 GntR family transcriptional regulator [Nocardia puris]RBO90608.1 DNA-binding GntR family transcriptional regulator [Nocardia puris]
MNGKGRVPLSERVYRSLRRDLAAGALVPTERLGEEKLAEIYGASRTPVRAALARLEADGLVERHPDGLYPYRPRLEELDNLFELRMVLETRGIQRVLADGDAHDLTVIEAELEWWQRFGAEPGEPGPALVAADERFHLTLLAAAGNAALAEALTAVYVRVRPVRTLDLPTPERVATMTAEHIAIAERLLAGEVDLALHTLVAHIGSARRHVLARAEQALKLTRLGRAVRD